MADDDDRLIEQEREATTPSASAARLFDVRRVIGALFVVYGLVVGVVGLVDSPGQLTKAQGVRINLWAGLAMLGFGGLMLLWQWLSPARPPEPPQEQPPREQPPGEQPSQEHPAGERPSEE
jgi:hypothetical protein